MRALAFFLLFAVAWAQGYLVGRVLEVHPQEGWAWVEAEGERLRAELPLEGRGFRPGDRVVLYRDGDRFYVTEPDRMPWLLGLFGGFFLLTALLARGKGVRGILGTLLSLVVVVQFIVPGVAGGGNPLLYAFLGSLGVLFLTVYWVHGVNRKTTAALLGTLVSVALVLLLAGLLAQALRFTGLVSEEALLLRQWGGVDLLALYLAGVAVGALGALTDVTVTQAAAVSALARANPALGFRGLYRRGMEVGYDHMGSLVNTLVLAYSAGALPLFLLLHRDPTPWRFLLNTEPFAAEILSMLLGSMGLLLAVPFTTLVAAWFFQGGRGEGEEAHHHHV